MKLLIVIMIKLRYCNTASGTKHSINLICQDPECNKVIIKKREGGERKQEQKRHVIERNQVRKVHTETGGGQIQSAQMSDQVSQ